MLDGIPVTKLAKTKHSSRLKAWTATGEKSPMPHYFWIQKLTREGIAVEFSTPVHWHQDCDRD